MAIYGDTTRKTAAAWADRYFGRQRRRVSTGNLPIDPSLPPSAPFQPALDTINKEHLHDLFLGAGATSEAQLSALVEIRQRALDLCEVIVARCKPSPDVTDAVRNVRVAAWFAEAAILQEGNRCQTPH